ncbi:hypothetical protein AM593_02951, partial [Mytilus galloprovincialis]
LNLVNFLLKRAYKNPNEENQNGDTLLHSAVESGYLDMVQLILEKPGIEPTEVNEVGDKLLLEKPDMDPNKLNKIGNTPLHCAVIRGFPEIVQFLLQRKDLVSWVIA